MRWEALMDFIKDLPADLIAYVTNYADTIGTRVAPIPIFTSALVALALYLYLRRTGKITRPFLTWLVPREIYFHPSHRLDVKLFLVNRLLGFLEIFAYLSFSSGLAVGTVLWLADVTGKPYWDRELTPYDLAALTLVLALTTDFTSYWLHRIYHETRLLWAFHSLHHSAEVLTPMTVERGHPVPRFVNFAVQAFVLGSVEGVLMFYVVGHIDYHMIGGVNAIIIIFRLTGSNLRHSHIWLSYGPILEHIFISPAVHQIHHSIELGHDRKNYGQIFAIWDWMFGTLYIPQGKMDLTFGIRSADGTRIEQPHPTLTRALIQPFIDMGPILGTYLRRARRVE